MGFYLNSDFNPGCCGPLHQFGFSVVLFSSRVKDPPNRSIFLFVFTISPTLGNQPVAVVVAGRSYGGGANRVYRW